YKNLSRTSEYARDRTDLWGLSPNVKCLVRRIRVSPCSGCETGHPSPPFALRSGDNLYVPRT
ncbi:MAG: hypothetical protein, partial [Olavius algarvensis Gamma 1 endosymbiont]